MPKPIDPINRALDAYSALDTDQKMIFSAALRYIEHAIAQMDRSVDYVKPQDETKRRGRPPGSKNRAKYESVSTPDNIELIEKLYGNNGAVEEGL